MHVKKARRARSRRNRVVRAVDLLLAGRVDLVAGPREVVRAALRERQTGRADEIEESTPALQVNQVRFAISRRSWTTPPSPRP